MHVTQKAGVKRLRLRIFFYEVKQRKKNDVIGVPRGIKPGKAAWLAILDTTAPPKLAGRLLLKANHKQAVTEVLFRLGGVLFRVTEVFFALNGVLFRVNGVLFTLARVPFNLKCKNVFGHLVCFDCQSLSLL